MALRFKLLTWVPLSNFYDIICFTWFNFLQLLLRLCVIYVHFTATEWCNKQI